jgi:hypothetical protein
VPDPRIPPLEYLLDCSENSLADLELAALNRSQQCLKVAKAEWEEAVAQREAAGVARWLIENRRELFRQASVTIEQDAIHFPTSKTA